MKFILLLLLLSGMLYSQTHSIVRLSGDEFLRPVEPSIAINPTNPDNIIGAGIRYGQDYEARVLNMRYHSHDGGKTWKIYQEANPDWRPQGDDAVTFNLDGIAYHSYISFRGLRTTKPKANGIFMTYSEKNTDVWQDPVVVVDHINTHRPYEDKPYLITDNSTTSQHQGNIYIAWTRFDEYNSPFPYDSTQIVFSRSTDGGRTFDPPFRISDSGGDCADGDDTVEGAVPAVGADGEVYVAWSGPKGMMFDKSTDGGKTFGKDKVLWDLPGGWDLDIPGIYRCNGFPVTKADLSDGPNRGRVYINWVDLRNGDHDVLLAYSDDQGETWTDPIRVNDDEKGNGKDQFFTWLAIDPGDGSVNLIFYDRRRHEGTKTDVILARSVDGAKTFVNHRLDMEPFECDESTFFGDYTGIDAYHGRVAGIFPHFIAPKNTAISAVIFNFKPGSQETLSK